MISCYVIPDCPDISSKGTMRLLLIEDEKKVADFVARIIYERGLTGTSLGTLALAAGAIGDAGAWCILAIVLASFGAGPLVAVKAIGGGVVFAILVFTLGRKL